MKDTWGLLSGRRFTPEETGEITFHAGERVDPSKQRLWIKRHFRGEVPDAHHYWRRTEEGRHSRYTWAGVQMLAAFSDVARDLGPEEAKAALLRRVPKHVHRSDYFEHDLRRLKDKEPDLLLFFGFDLPQEQRYFSGTTPDRLGGHLKGHWATRAYVWNFSVFQQRIVDAALKALNGDLAETA